MSVCNEQLLKQGAEARVSTCYYMGKPTIIKERFTKAYRHPDLDAALTRERMKNETRAIVRCKDIDIKVPTIYLIGFGRQTIYMEHFQHSITVKDFIINHVSDASDSRLSLIMKMIGETVRKLHEENIIHGDLTTSNMLLTPNKNQSVYSDWINSQNLELAMIDFGLSSLDASTEDKGVDLYVLERALISTHNDYPKLFSLILEAYKSTTRCSQSCRESNIKEIINKFEEVRARGRKRTMVG